MIMPKKKAKKILVDIEDLERILRTHRLNDGERRIFMGLIEKAVRSLPSKYRALY